MKIYEALVKAIGQEVEEEVVLNLNGFDITCFIDFCPYEICEGEIYPVLFELMIFDDYNVEKVKLKTDAAGFERIGNSFSYWVEGVLEQGVIDCGIQFKDEVLLSDYGYLDGELIRLKVDRIDVEFLDY